MDRDRTGGLERWQKMDCFAERIPAIFCNLTYRLLHFYVVPGTIKKEYNDCYRLGEMEYE